MKVSVAVYSSSSHGPVILAVHKVIHHPVTIQSTLQYSLQYS